MTRTAATATLVFVLLPAAPAAAAPPEAPVLVAPAPDHVFDVDDPQVFTVRAVDPDGDRWIGVLELTNEDTGTTTSVVTAPSTSGSFAGAVALPPLPPGRYAWRAHAVDVHGEAGPWSEHRGFRVGTNRAPAVPVLLTPAAGATLRRIGNEPFAISAIDPDNDPVRGTVVIRRAGSGTEVTRFPTGPTTSGGVSTGLLLEVLAEGDYTWAAQATDVHGAQSPFSAERPFSVRPPATSGAGLVAGTIAFSPGVPPGSCEPQSSTWTLHSEAAVFNTAFSGHVGPVQLTGTGASGCEDTVGGGGTVTLDAAGSGPTGSTLACTSFTGTYTRLANTLRVVVVGPCRINNLPVSRVVLVVVAEVTPTQPGAGVTVRMHELVVAGAFVVRPE